MESEQPNVEAVVALLHDAGYRAVIRETNIIESSTNGLKYFLFVRESGWLQFAVSLRNSGGYDYAVTNEFNRRWRFCRVYHDEEDDLVLTGDFYLTGNFKKTFDEYLLVWDDLTSTFLNFTREKKPADASSREIADPA